MFSGADVFARAPLGQACRFIAGPTLVSQTVTIFFRPLQEQGPLQRRGARVPGERLRCAVLLHHAPGQPTAICGGGRCAVQSAIL